MIFKSLALGGAFLIDLEKREDSRGFFSRYFCEKEYSAHGLETRWVQMNTSLTRQPGSLRGLHFQRPPKAEAKVVRCLSGAIWDVLVDLRMGSPSFGKWLGFELNDENRTMLYIPKGFAHGFQTLTDDCEMLYFHTATYQAGAEGGLNALDFRLAIKWPLGVTILSDRDRSHPMLTNEFEGFSEEHNHAKHH